MEEQKAVIRIYCIGEEQIKLYIIKVNMNWLDKLRKHLYIVSDNKVF